eukprot:363865-Chlamydomonas_euryale.AAC.12
MATSPRLQPPGARTTRPAAAAAPPSLKEKHVCCRKERIVPCCAHQALSATHPGQKKNVPLPPPHRHPPEHAVDRKVLCRPKAVLRQLVQHARRHCRRVRAQQVVGRNAADGRSGLGQKEGVVCVARRVLLRLEQRVKVPERRLDIVVRGHLLKAHLREDLAELRANLHGGSNGGGSVAAISVRQSRQ